METVGDENIKEFVAQIQRELFRMVRLLIMLLYMQYVCVVSCIIRSVSHTCKDELGLMM